MRRALSIAVTTALALAAGAAIWVWWQVHTPCLPLLPGVVARCERMRLGGFDTRVDIYVPAGATQTWTAVIAHGFPRSRRNMAGWGALLAAHGFTAAVPDLSPRAGHRRNGRAIAELLDAIHAGAITGLPRPIGRGVLIGMSAGGASTLFAAETNALVGCWIGLDPVLGSATGRRAAASLTTPCAVLRAEPAPCNDHGRAEIIAELVRGPLLAFRVCRATHCDAEWPSNRLGELVCGKTDESRGRVFRDYALAAALAAVADDSDARARLRGASQDDRVADVVVRDLDGFRPAGQ